MKITIDFIKGLQWDARLEWLATTPEFSEAPRKLQYLKEQLILKKKLLSEQKAYVAKVYKHVCNIKPHIELLTVNGEEDQPVQFATTGE